MIKVNLKYKILIFVGITLIILSTGLTVLFQYHTRLYVEREFKDDGITRIKELAIISVEPVLSGNLFNGLDPIISAYEGSSVEYVIFTDNTGKVIAHSNKEEIGKIYNDSVTANALSASAPVLYYYKNGIDFGLQIVNTDRSALGKAAGLDYENEVESVTKNKKIIGAVRMGISTERYKSGLNRILSICIVISIFIIIIEVFFAFIFSRKLSNPIKKLKDTASQIGEGNFNIKAEVKTGDELEVLASTFNSMTKRLSETTVSKNYLDNIIKSMINSLMVVNRKGIIKEVNKSTLELLGYTYEELYNQSITKILGDEFIENKLIKIIKGESVKNIEIIYKTKNRDNIPVLFSGSVLKNYEGNILGVLLVGQDISQMKIVEKQLDNRNKELEMFMYRTSHDLRSPIASSLGLINIMKSEITDTLALKYIDMLEGSMLNLDKIVMELIRIVKIKNSDLNKTKIDLNKMFTTLFNRFDYVSGKEIDIQLKISKKKNIYTDESLLSSILQNLLDNSFKYRRHNCKSFVKININNVAQGTLIIFEDNGQGIPKSLLGKVFDMFYRANEESKGSGLGLYIVKTAIERLGGQIEVHSKEKEGTKFTIYLPDEDIINQNRNLENVEAIK